MTHLAGHICSKLFLLCRHFAMVAFFGVQNMPLRRSFAVVRGLCSFSGRVCILQKLPGNELMISRLTFLTLSSEDELFFGEGRDIVVGNVYQSRDKPSG